MGALKPWHIIVFAVVVLVLFGAGKLPGFARSLGQSLRIFKAETKAMKDDDVELPAATTTAQIAAMAQPPVAVPPVAVPPVAVPIAVPVAQPVTLPETPGTPPRLDN